MQQKSNEKSSNLLAQQAWRETLKNIFKEDQRDTLEGRRIVSQTGFNMITINRWIEGTSTPRKPYLKKLLESLQPEDRNRLFPQLEEANLVDDSFTYEQEASEETLKEDYFAPAEFCDRVCQTVSTTSHHLRKWTICQLILRQCSAQLISLQPELSELMISIVTCTPPLSGYPVRSLRELAYVNIRTYEEGKIELNTRFLLGAESLPGQTSVTLQEAEEQPLVLESTLGLRHFFPSARSAASSPMLRSGRLGGCILLVSSQENFFTKQRMRLIQSYASLAALAFVGENFYDLSNIALALMPAPHRQEIVSTVRQRIISLMRPTTSQQEAEILAWHNIENEHISHAEQPR